MAGSGEGNCLMPVERIEFRTPPNGFPKMKTVQTEYHEGEKGFELDGELYYVLSETKEYMDDKICLHDIVIRQICKIESIEVKIEV
jgi:hypothetical protein